MPASPVACRSRPSRSPARAWRPAAVASATARSAAATATAAHRGYGDRPRERRSYGDRPTGDRPLRRPRRRPATGDRPTGDRSYGDRPQRRRARYGDRPTGDRTYGDRPAGDRPRPPTRGTGRPSDRRPQLRRPRDGAHRRASGELPARAHRATTAARAPTATAASARPPGPHLLIDRTRSPGTARAPGLRLSGVFTGAPGDGRGPSMATLPAAHCSGTVRTPPAPSTRSSTPAPAVRPGHPPRRRPDRLHLPLRDADRPGLGHQPARRDHRGRRLGPDPAPGAGRRALAGDDLRAGQPGRGADRAPGTPGRVCPAPRTPTCCTGRSTSI